MLDLGTALELPDLPNVAIHRDDQIALGFYAWSKAPRITSNHGRYDLRLIVYGQDSGGQFEPRGGLLTLTTAIELTELEQQQLRASLIAYLTPPGATGGAPPEPEFLAPEFLDGSAELRLAPERTLTGKPSLYAGNRTVFSVQIDTAAIGDFLRTWKAGLEGAMITYSLRVRARPAPANLILTAAVMPRDARPLDYLTQVTL